MTANKFEKILTGKVVKSVKCVHGYLQIEFVDGVTLIVFNDFTTSGGVIELVTGQRIIATNTTRTAFTMEFSGGCQMLVGVSDADFAGPEAMTLWCNPGDILVWT